MKVQTSLLLVALQMLAVPNAGFAAKLLYGKLTTVPSGDLVLSNGAAMLPLRFTEPTAGYAKSLIPWASFVKITEGEDQVPTIISGDRVLEGRFASSLVDDSAEFSINGIPAKFGRTKMIYGSEFDAKSMAYFEGKQVRAVAIEENGKFVIQSILRRDMFTAAARPLVDKDIPRSLILGMQNDPMNTISKMVKGELPSPYGAWFRWPIFKASQTVQPGEPVLLISVSGGQGDSLGSVNGHFAAGYGRVGKDLEIDGEMFNVYVTNKKEITPGNVELVDYFGHIVSGQLNYRPTYTIAIYGLTEEAIFRVKSQLDRFHPLFREGNTKITVNKNCVTMSVQALADIGIYGAHRNGLNGSEQYKLLSKQTGFPPELNFIQEVKFIAETKRAEFMPGPAFVSLIENLAEVNEREHLHIKRVDFIYSGQTPSARKAGQAPTATIADQFATQAVMGGAQVKGAARKAVKQSVKRVLKRSSQP